MRNHILAHLYKIFLLSLQLGIFFAIISQPVIVSADFSVGDDILITKDLNGFLAEEVFRDSFGHAIANIGDIDGDGIADLAVGAPDDNEFVSGGPSLGSVWILFMNANDTVKGQQKISSLEGNLIPALTNEAFGYSVTSIGDLNQDGTPDIAVGSLTSSSLRGRVRILFLNTDGTVKSSSIIDNSTVGFTNSLDTNDQFGYSLSSADFDNDGQIELLVGARNDDDGLINPVDPVNSSLNKGAVWILELNTSGVIVEIDKISASSVNFTNRLTGQDRFGQSVASIGDLDVDGIEDLAVGSDEPLSTGAVWILFMNSDKTVKTAKKIYPGVQGFSDLTFPSDSFARSIALLGDQNNDGYVEIVVGAPSHEYPNSSLGFGALWVLSLDSSGYVNSSYKISSSSLANVDHGGAYKSEYFGQAITYFGSSSGFTFAVGSPIFRCATYECGAIRLISLISEEENDFPVLVPIDPQVVSESTQLTFTTPATDPDADPLTYSATNLPLGATYNVTTGEFSWTPDYDDAGIYEVTFTVSDGSLTDSETVSIEVTNTNRPPVLASIGNQTVTENQNLTFTLSATDPDGDTLTYSALNLPAGSTFNPTTRVFSWTPTYAQSGNYENIEFTVSDNGSPMELAVELITITVGNINRSPELTNPGPQQILEEDLLSFNTTATDPDADSVSLSASGVPSGATFNTTTGSFTWTPTLTEEGIYTVTITATDNGSPVETSALDVVITVGDNPTPVEQAEDLITLVTDFNLPTSVENAYMANLQKVGTFIEAGNIQAAINQLNAFINKVNQNYAQGKITLAERNAMVAAAQQLIGELN